MKISSRVVLEVWRSLGEEEKGATSENANTILCTRQLSKEMSAMGINAMITGEFMLYTGVVYKRWLIYVNVQ
jgi:hypothetical protein